MLTSGGTAKTQNYRMTYWWPALGHTRDFRVFADVGQWVAGNSKALDKKSAPEVAKLLSEQFPSLASIEVMHHNGPMARWEA